MNRTTVQEVDGDSTNGRLFKAGIMAVEVAFDCNVLAFVCRDAKGVFIAPRPGTELQLIDFFENAHWANARRAIQEFRV